MDVIQTEEHKNRSKKEKNKTYTSVGLVLLNTSEGQKNLPDNTVLVMHLGSALDEETFIAAFDKFRLHLLRLCHKHRIQHLAYDFAPPRPELPTTVPADCLCHRLYED